MRCLLIQITRTRRGQPMRAAHIIEGESLKLGRGAECAINLPNPRVALVHAILRPAADGRLSIEAHTDPISVNGVIVRSARLRPDTRILIGPYELVVELAGAEGYPEHDFALTVEFNENASMTKGKARRRVPMTLREAGLGRRLPSFVLALLVGLGFLVLPLLQAARPDLLPERLREDKLIATSWNPGLLAAGHRGFAADCKSCHAQAWQHVADAECEKCHDGTAAHIANASLQQASFGNLRCAECHRDHRGLAGMQDIDPALCVRCHGDIRARHLDTTLPDIRDFKDDHPPFRLSLLRGPGAADIERISQDVKGGVHQDTGLKFNHEKHLDPRGIESPGVGSDKGGRVVLECVNCHRASASGVGFEPVRMEQHCAQCHRLEFEPALNSREVPHGSVAKVTDSLREFYASAALGSTRLDVETVDGLLHQPLTRTTEVRRRDAIAWANEKAQAVATDLIEVRVCVVCHEVTRRSATELAASGNPDPAAWTIRPILVTQRWLPGARFEHQRHAGVPCANCHAVQHQKTNTEVAMPDIAQCRSCHVGARPEHDKVTSGCELCHGFHNHLEPGQPSRMERMLKASRGSADEAGLAPPTDGLTARAVQP